MLGKSEQEARTFATCRVERRVVFVVRWLNACLGLGGRCGFGFGVFGRRIRLGLVARGSRRGLRDLVGGRFVFGLFAHLELKIDEGDCLEARHLTH
jgi:hypothetical protein